MTAKQASAEWAILALMGRRRVAGTAGSQSAFPIWRTEDDLVDEKLQREAFRKRTGNPMQEDLFSAAQDGDSAAARQARHA